jgi:hypothetical protein
MMAAPPMKTGAVQDRPKVDLVLEATTSASEVGAAGVVVIMAPLPAADTVELP